MRPPCAHPTASAVKHPRGLTAKEPGVGLRDSRQKDAPAATASKTRTMNFEGQIQSRQQYRISLQKTERIAHRAGTAVDLPALPQLGSEIGG
jgi:hypothetical protein